METKISNPAPLGLMGFGMTTVLLNLHNAGFFDLGSMIIAMGIFYGGFAQIIAGILEFKKGNTFATTAFTSYGLFWLSLVTLILLPKTGLVAAPTSTAMAAYFIMWGIFTTYMFAATPKLNRGLQVVFSTLLILFYLLAAVELTGSALLKMIAGYEGIFCGLSAIYVACAEVINEVYKKQELPL